MEIKAQNCPYCGSENCVKNGVIKERQRYQCKDCSKNYYKSIALKTDIRRYAIIMYLEGVNFTDIAKRLSVSWHTVKSWISPFEELLKPLRNMRKCEVKKFEKIETYIDCNTYNLDRIISSAFIIIEKEEKTMISTFGNEQEKKILNNPDKVKPDIKDIEIGKEFVKKKKKEELVSFL
jgi:transposase